VRDVSTALDMTSDSRPVVAFYFAPFLKPEMLHIYRQITALERCQPVVIAPKRENAAAFPFDKIDIVPKPATHFWRRLWYRQLRDRPWQISSHEVRALSATLERAHAQFLHIFFGQIAVHLLPLIRVWPRPTIVSFHGADVLVDMEKPAYRAATQQMLDAVRRVFVRSESLRHAVINLGCAENKIDIVRTGIPLAQFPFREREYPQDGKWRFVQAGRLIEKKGVPTSLRAFAKFTDRYPESKFTVAGEGPLLTQLQDLARQLEIDSRVSFTGFVSQKDLRELLYASHIFLQPSETGRDGNQEGVPNAMLEAMASGLPVFATQHGGIPEAIENGVSGVLVPEQDHDALARALLDAVQDRQLLLSLARIGADEVAQKFEQGNQIRRLEELYLRLASAIDPN
jgi:colanic acid/amylovoran biosynthesis glycosyltransferase